MLDDFLVNKPIYANNNHGVKSKVPLVVLQQQADPPVNSKPIPVSDSQDNNDRDNSDK